MSSKSSLFLRSLILAGSVASQTTEDVLASTKQLFLPFQEVSTYSASVVAKETTATTYELSCPTGESAFICAVAPLTVTEGISWVEFGWDARTSGTSTIPSNYVSCTVAGNDDKVTCAGNYDGNTSSSTAESAHTMLVTAVITAGVEKLTATGASPTGGSTAPRSQTTMTQAAGSSGTTTSPLVSINGVANLAGNSVVAGAAALVAAAAIL